MNKQLKKVIKGVAAAVFVLALAINVKVTLDDPFLSVSESAIAQESSQTSSDQKWIRKKVKCPNGVYGYGCFDGSNESCTPENCD